MKKCFYVYDNTNKEILADFGGCYLYKSESKAKEIIKRIFQCDDVEECIKKYNLVIKATTQTIF